MIWLQLIWGLAKLPYQAWRTYRALKRHQRAREGLTRSAERLALAEERLKRAKRKGVVWVIGTPHPDAVAEDFYKRIRGDG